MVPSAPMHATAHALQAVEADYAAEAGYAEEQPEAPVAHRASEQPAPRSAQPVRQSPRYAEAPTAESAQPARKSLFGIVTGAIRGSLPATPAEAQGQPARSEPSLHQTSHEALTRTNVRQTAGEDMGIDIPAFLRRQTS